MELYDEAIDTLYRATWDYAFHSAAYIELARISCLMGDLQKALDQINESLSTNAVNNSAMNLKASIQRNLGDIEGAGKTLAEIIGKDPLDFRACNENYLVEKKSGNLKQSDEKLADLKRKMRGFDQNYLELAAGYMNDGLFAEAEDVLRRFEGNNQEINYYLGFLQDRKGNKTDAEKYFRTASELPPDYGFPYRLESVKVLALASQYNPGDARPYYYMGNLLYDKQPGKALENWENAVRIDPSLAIAWRNLGFGYYQHSKDITKAINAYEKAVSIKNDDPIYYAELDPLYEMNNTPIETRSSNTMNQSQIAGSGVVQPHAGGHQRCRHGLQPDRRRAGNVDPGGQLSPLLHWLGPAGLWPGGRVGPDAGRDQSDPDCGHAAHHPYER